MHCTTGGTLHKAYLSRASLRQGKPLQNATYRINVADTVTLRCCGTTESTLVEESTVGLLTESASFDAPLI